MTDDEGSFSFVHPMETEFARLLDFYHIPWIYEPTSFALNWSGDQVIEMFTPDFYLPDQDLYVELTTMRQRLVTRKHRKLRRLRELYPNINIRLLYNRDYHQLIASYGYGAVEIASLREEEIERILVSRDELADARGGARRGDLARLCRAGDPADRRPERGHLLHCRPGAGDQSPGRARLPGDRAPGARQQRAPGAHRQGPRPRYRRAARHPVSRTSSTPA